MGLFYVFIFGRSSSPSLSITGLKNCLKNKYKIPKVQEKKHFALSKTDDFSQLFGITEKHQ